VGGGGEGFGEEKKGLLEITVSGPLKKKLQKGGWKRNGSQEKGVANDVKKEYRPKRNTIISVSKLNKGRNPKKNGGLGCYRKSSKG